MSAGLTNDGDPLASAAALTDALERTDYLVDEGLAMALFLAVEVGQPLLLEGEPGVGKTAAARALAEALDARLIRLQCYEGITAAEALYEWDHPRQLLAIRLAESADRVDDLDVFDEAYLLDRPLLAALRASRSGPVVLLVDEVDRADDEFEALLLEFLGDASVSVPEVGTLTTDTPPIVILTSNRTRELHDALKRRCYYHWIDYPDVEHVARIVQRRVPGAAVDLVEAAAGYVTAARARDLDKVPGLAEAIDWVRALERLGVHRLDRTAALATLGALAKSPDDRDTLTAATDDLLSVDLLSDDLLSDDG
ncbi:MAG: AAA family ATPase [Acidimicrobiales bacterium]